MANAQAVGDLLGIFQQVVDLGERLVAHEAGNLQGKLREDLAVPDYHDAAFVFSNAVDGKGHILIGGADADDVVAVVGDRGGYCACFQAVALQIANADVAGVLVAFYYGHFQDIMIQVHSLGIALIFRDDLAVDHADDDLAAGFCEVCGGENGQVEGIVGLGVQVGGDLGLGEINDLALAVCQLAALIDGDHVEILQVFHNGKVGKIARRDGAPVVQQKVPGCMEAGDLNDLDGIGAHADSFPTDVVDVALFQEVAGMLVVGAEHAAVIVLRRFDQGHQGFQVPGGGAVPNHDELAQAQLVQGVLRVGALVVGVDAGGDVGVQSFSGEARRMAVDFLVVGLGGDDFGGGGAVGSHDAGIVHHLGKAQNTGMLKETVDVPVVQVGAAFVHGGGGDAGGHHEHRVHGQVLGGGKHIVNAVGAHDIGDLVGVGDDRGGAVGNDGPDKFAGAYQAGFQVDVGVDEAGADDFAGHIHFFDPFVLAKAHDQALGNGNILGFQFSGEDIHVGGVFQNEICFLAASRSVDDVQLLDQLAVDHAGPGFSVAHRIIPP